MRRPWGDAELVRRLPTVATPDDGRHIYIRCENIQGNQVLAKDEAGKTLIETRGQGGYAIAPGSPLSVHPTFRPYRLLTGDLCQVPIVSSEQRERLLTAARSFNRWKPPVKVYTPPLSAAERYGSSLERPGDRFNREANWADILEPHGWEIVSERGAETYWRKPGSRGKEHHATTNGGGKDKLYMFSCSAPPFCPNESYSKFAAHVLLAYGGDFSAAAKDLTNRKEMNNER